jgi:hypothetical protein
MISCCLLSSVLANIFGRSVYSTITIHTRHHSDTPNVASSFIFAIYSEYHLVDHPRPLICL